MTKNKILSALIISSVLTLSLIYRASGLQIAHPFWVDEFATVAQAKLVNHYGLSVFAQSDYHFEYHNVTTHFLTALTFILFGTSEQTARLPALLFGSLVPVLIYLLSIKLTGSKIAGLSSALLAAFSYFLITWSVQARSYSLQQFLLLATLIVYVNWLENKKYLHAVILVILVALGLLTHTTYLLVVMGLLIHYLYLNKYKLKSILFRQATYLLMLPILLVAIYSGAVRNLINYFSDLLANGLINNLWYYHAFLWRQQTVTVLLGAMGLTILSVKKPKMGILLALILADFLIFVCFLFSPYVSRYLLAIWPIFLIGAGYFLTQVSQLFSRRNKPSVLTQLILPILLTLFIIINGDKFVIKPKSYYSVNHDMREIAVINYNQAFDLIKAKGELEKGKTAVIDTWVPRSEWYLGKQNYIYWFLWQDEPGKVNGLSKKTNFIQNSAGDKFIPKSGNPAIGYVGELSDLQKVMTKYPQGFIWIDDASLPSDVLNYVREKMKPELYLDHYQYDDNPYSIWPATLYSWGYDTVNPYYSAENDLESSGD